jgi:hypothetical protein
MPYGFKFRFEDCHYGHYDLDYLTWTLFNESTPDTDYVNTRRIKIMPSNDGSGWAGTHGDNGEYVFITFKPLDPVRQILASYLFDAEPFKDSQMAEKNKILPRAIICRAPRSHIPRGDETDERVERWFEEKYELVQKFSDDDEATFDGEMNLFILRSKKAGNSPRPRVCKALLRYIWETWRDVSTWRQWWYTTVCCSRRVGHVARCRLFIIAL